MKKLLCVLLLTLAACDGTTTNKALVTDTAHATGDKYATIKNKNGTSCIPIKGVNDPENGGKIYYTPEHKLYKFIKVDTKQGDHNFCTLTEANRAGFDTKAPEHFKDSTYNLLQCLKSESAGGKCHKYVSGVYQSLIIYDKICRQSNPDFAGTIEKNAENTKDGYDVSKYHGTATAFIKYYRCH